METLLVIDGNSLINRAFYGTQSSYMKNADGLYTGALFGFMNMYLRHFDVIKPQYVAVAFDLKAPTFRHNMYDKYKGTRKPMPEELAAQMPVLKELLDAMNICRIEIEGYEADDIIGTCSYIASQREPHIRTVILTGDRDSLQLINETTQVMLLTSKPGQSVGELFDTMRVREKYGIEPLSLIDVKALMGDSSDNIPGVPGVGEKTALSLIESYGTLDSVYEHIDEISKPALKAKLADNKELAYLSRKLGEICLSVPLTVSIDEMSVREPNAEALSDMLDILEFKALKKRLQEVAGVQTADVNSASARVDESDSAGSAGDGSNNDSDELTLFDFESEGIASIDDDCISAEEFVALQPKKLYIYVADNGHGIGCVYITTEAADKKMRLSNESSSDSGSSLQIIANILEDENIPKYMFNAKPFILLCLRSGIEVRNICSDLTIASYLIDSTRKSDDYAQVLRFISGRNVLPDVRSLPKACEEADVKLKEGGLTELYSKIEIPLISVLARMESCGFRVDGDVLARSGAEMDARIMQLRDEIYELAGRDFNINSTKQLGTILFDELHLKSGRKIKTGYSTDSDVLEGLEGEHPIIGKVLEYRRSTKLKSTYIDGLRALISPETGRVFSTFHQNITATGRLSSSEPNLQNIPIRSEEGKQIRKAFVPADSDHVLIDADYSQIELRVLAAMSGDATMIDAFKHDMDIHSITAAQVAGIPLEMVTPQMRARAKAVNFGIVYGISEFGLARDLGIARYEAKEYIEGYFTRYPGIRSFMDDMVERAKTCGYAETLLGRRRLLPELKSSKYMTRRFGERVAMNMPIQGTAADIIKIAMIRVDEALRRGGYASRLILQVHDELLIDAVKDEEQAVTELLRSSMEDAYKLEVPLNVDISSSPISWYYCK